MRAIDHIARVYEYVSKSYRYPDTLIGRTRQALLSPCSADIIVFAAHPDDEVLALGTVIHRHRKQGENVSVVFTTNGKGGTGWIISPVVAQQVANMRMEEARRALSVIDIHRKNIYCFGFPDGGLYRYIEECINDVTVLIATVRPTRLYVHCMDGGHVDHDVTNLCVRAACIRMKYTEVYEWAEYNAYTSLEEKVFRFPGEVETNPIVPTDEERTIKMVMLSKYKSQFHVLDKYKHKHENVRKAVLNGNYLIPNPVYSEELRRRVCQAACGTSAGAIWGRKI